MIVFFFFNDTATPEIYTLSLHDALPICRRLWSDPAMAMTADQLPDDPRTLKAMVLAQEAENARLRQIIKEDRKSTRLNSSHANISYAVFCLKKKKKHL